MVLGDISAIGWTAVKHLTPKFIKPYLRPLYLKIIKDRDWTEAELAILLLIAPADRESVDIGANVGSYTAILSKLTTRVHAFEPDEELAHRVEAAGYPNVQVYPQALSDREGSQILRVPIIDGKRQVALASLELVTNQSVMSAAVVSVSTLDGLIDRDIGFVKIDVEGHEIQVLRGGRKLMAKHRPVVLVETEERHRPGSLDMITDYFAGLSYTGIFIYAGKARPLVELTSKMTDERQLNRPVARKHIQYVNNFIFFPDRFAAIETASQINAYLTKKK
jgi:FkbM family methyltransferase